MKIQYGIFRIHKHIPSGLKRQVLRRYQLQGRTGSALETIAMFLNLSPQRTDNVRQKAPDMRKRH